jgi:hypothetical protein
MDKLDPSEVSWKDMTQPERVVLSDALRALGLADYDIARLVSPDLPKLVLTALEGSLHEALGDDPTWTLWGKRDAVIDALGNDALGGYGADRNHAIASRLVDNMYNLFVMIAVSEFLSITESKYAKLRDQATTRHGHFRPAALRELRRGFLTLSLNLVGVHRDVESFWARPWRWEGDAVFSWRDATKTKVGDAESKEAELTRAAATFNERLRERHDIRFARLLEADRNYRDILSTVASLGASVDAFKTGRWAVWVALGSLAVAVLALLITDQGNNNLLAAISTWVQGG